MKAFLVIILLVAALSGCESLPLRDGELAIGKDTTAGIEDLGVGKIRNKF